jgi:signal transduction histidine kinase/CheY-like chemotaxis protein
VVLALLGSAIARGQLYVVEQLADSVARHRALAEREKAQRLALEESERVQAHEREQRAQAQQALERSRRTEALARVAGGVAHDFNNALTIILGAAEAAKEDGRSLEDIETHLDGIIEAARHASALTSQLLTLGRQRLSTPAHVSITAFLARIRPAFARVLPADILLTVDMPTDDIPVHVDQTSMDRALLNLVLNARDAMPGGGHITISCRRDVVSSDPRLAPGPHLVLQVNDDGAGMDQETLERVFDPFFTTKGDKGTGLGLASVHAFANEAGGAVDVVSAPGRGTTFTLWLPESTAAPPADAVEATASVAPARLSGRILVVEDLQEVRTMMTRVLTLRGFDVVEAKNGDHALAVLEADPRFSLMCIDGVMPGISTATTIDRARALAPDMRVIVCSGHVQEDLLRRGIETGRYEFLQKPFTSQDLITRISRTLEPAPN